MTKKLLVLMSVALSRHACAVDFAFISAPRTTGKFHTQSVSETWGPYRFNPEAQLVIKRDGQSPQVVVHSGAYDWRRSRDGTSLLVTIVTGYQFRSPYEMPDGNADVYRYDLATGKITNLTPDTPDSWEIQPVEFNGGVAFLSNRDGWQNPHEAYRAFTIYRMRDDGREVERIWHAGLGGVFGLNVGKNGRLYFGSGENQGFRGGYGNSWSIWSVNPDGSGFQPEMTATHYKRVRVFDFPCVTSDGTLAWADYYDTRIYGTILAAPVWSPSSAEVADNPTQFQSPLAQNNTGVNGLRWAWARRGLYELTVQADAEDFENAIQRPDGGKDYLGMYSHPAPMPGNGLLWTWTGNKGDKQMDLGVYGIPNVSPQTVATTYYEMVKIVDEPDRHEYMGGPICSDAEIYSAPLPLPEGEVAEELPFGSPFGVIGTSAVDVNEWIEQFQDVTNDTTRLTPDPEAMEYVRILAFNPTLNKKVQGVGKVFNGDAVRTAKVENLEGFSSEINERVGFYDQLIPLKKWRTPDGSLYLGPNPPDGSERIMREDGRPDTSWQAQVPANQPWSLQLLNAKKEVVVGSTAQTWHQVVSRERRTNCQGCHAHWKPDTTPFSMTFAASPEYRPYIPRLHRVANVVYERDIEPLNVDIPRRPWSNGMVQTYGSALTNLDDNPNLLSQEQELVRTWIDTGMMAAGEIDDATIQPDSGEGPYRDTMGPTLVVHRFKDYTVVGVLDPQSGLQILDIRNDYYNLKSRFAFNPTENLFTLQGRFRGRLYVTAVDLHGNETRIVRERP